ncbi:transglycosylase SLT domain-containing protein, partial [Salmonella enterica]|uniref:transglycosylase SLT domain-containing protein n=1 Tax=Salmonella enterica TaxID=28901 RepID=UPI0020CA289D
PEWWEKQKGSRGIRRGQWYRLVFQFPIRELARYGIKPEHLTTDPCMNIYTGAYYLAIAFKKWGVTWEAVGAYNAGFRKSERQNQRRLAYASEVYRIYTGIKSSKGIRLPATKKSLPEINSVQNN